MTFSGGEGDHEYLKSFDDIISPAMRSYQPDLVLVSAGFDAHRLDPLGGMNVTADGFGRMSEALLAVAKEACGGRAIFVLEGGYSLEGLAESVEESLMVLCRPTFGKGSALHDPLDPPSMQKGPKII